MDNQIMGGDPAMQGAPQDDASDDMNNGYTIEITVGAGNKVESVNVEAKQEEAAEDQGAAPADADQEDQNDGGTPVQSIDEALQLAKSIFDNGGQMGDAGNDREAIAKQVFGNMAQSQAPGQLNTKSPIKRGY